MMPGDVFIYFVPQVIEEFAVFGGVWIGKYMLDGLVQWQAVGLLVGLCAHIPLGFSGC